MQRTETSHNTRRQVRHARVRARLKGSAAVPRLSVYRSLKGVTLQLIDDEAGKTLCAVDSKIVKAEPIKDKGAKVAASFAAGKELAAAALAKGITRVVFDRGGFRYHGRVAAAAEGARAGGLQF